MNYSIKLFSLICLLGIGQIAMGNDTHDNKKKKEKSMNTHKKCIEKIINKNSLKITGLRPVIYSTIKEKIYSTIKEKRPDLNDDIAHMMSLALTLHHLLYTCRGSKYNNSHIQ